MRAYEMLGLTLRQVRIKEDTTGAKPAKKRLRSMGIQSERNGEELMTGGKDRRAGCVTIVRRIQGRVNFGMG